MPLTPEGGSGEKTDKIMLLAMWANTLKKEAGDSSIKPMISAGMGKPTFPINMHTVEMFLEYWRGIESLVNKVQLSVEKVNESAAIDYGDARGDIEPRKLMAEAMSRWYNAPVNSENILFTVGGAGALRIIFETFNAIYKDIPKYRVITPFPHYTLYADNRHLLHPIDVMQEPGYQLTAKALKESIESANRLAEKDNNFPKVLLLSNPSNPLGTVISRLELGKIAEVLRANPDIQIVIDEAYAEMDWENEKIPSLLEIAPDLKERIIILRSATKALSAAGERMALLMAFNPVLMASLRDKNISTIGHAPRSAQIAYAHTMDKFGTKEQQDLKSFYQPKVEYIRKRIDEIGIAMPAPSYIPSGTFYVLADLSDLLGTPIAKSAKRALGKTGVIENSEELIYSLLFQESIMLAPGAYFGMPEKNGFVRITCSGANDELKTMMDRLESCVLQARQDRHNRLLDDLNTHLQLLLPIDPVTHKSVSEKLNRLTLTKNTVLELKNHNKELGELLSQVKVAFNKSSPEGRKKAALTINSFFAKAHAKHKQNDKQTQMQTEWKAFVDNTVTDGPLKNYFLNLSEADKLTYKPWVEHLKTVENSRNYPNTSS